MKYIPSGLLVAYTLYTPFISITPAHSIILFSLAALFGFSQYLEQLKQPSLEVELAKLKTELEQKAEVKNKEINEKLQRIEAELGRATLTLAQRPSSANPQAKIDKKVVF